MNNVIRLFAYRSNKAQIMKTSPIIALCTSFIGGGLNAATTTITGTTASGSGASPDSWNQAANWSGGVPTGTIDAEINAGLT
jgi:hypothetical protein